VKGVFFSVRTPDALTGKRPHIYKYSFPGSGRSIAGGGKMKKNEIFFASCGTYMYIYYCVKFYPIAAARGIVGLGGSFGGLSLLSFPITTIRRFVGRDGMVLSEFIVGASHPIAIVAHCRTGPTLSGFIMAALFPIAAIRLLPDGGSLCRNLLSSCSLKTKLFSKEGVFYV